MDSLSSKIGGGKRSAKELGQQLAQSARDGQTAFQKTGNVISAIFAPPKDWKTFGSYGIITKNNIDSYIPELNEASAGELLKEFQKQQAIINASPQTWDDYFKTRTGGKKWQIKFIQNTDLEKASAKDLMNANKAARDSILAHNQAIKAQTVAARAGKAALQGLATAGNMIIMMAAAKGIELLINWIDSLHTTLEEQREISQNLQSELTGIQSDISGVNSELEATASRMDELSKIKNPSFVEKEELQRLKEENEELQKRNTLLKDQEKEKKQEHADSVKEEFHKEYGEKVYEKIWSQDEIDALNAKKERYYELSGKYYTELTYDEQVELAELRPEIEKYSGPSPVSFEEHIGELINDYNRLLQKKRENGELLEDEEERLKDYRAELRDAAVDLDDYITRYDINDKTSKDWKKLYDDIYNSLYSAEYKTEQFNEIFGSLSDDVQNELKRMANDGSLAASDLTDDLVEQLEAAGITADEAVEQIYASFSISPDRRSGIFFQKILHSSDYAETKDRLLSLAKSGELTPETLSSTEEYARLLSDTKTSAEDAANQILDMLSAQEKLSAASKGLSSLSSAYEDFQSHGFVTASALEALPDVFKELEEYGQFESIASDPTKAAEEIQKAFDDIAAEYLLSQRSLSGLLTASEGEIQSYIANLKQMGYTNAEEIVAQALNLMNPQVPLVSEAEEEYYSMYLDYLQGKSEMDEDYLKDTSSKNGQLADALGSAYQTDYENWIDLLRRKAKSYNIFLNAVGGSYDESKSMIDNLKENGVPVTNPNIAAGNKARFAYYKDQKKFDNAKNAVNWALNAVQNGIDLSSYLPSSSNDTAAGAGAEAQKTAQTFDWTETLLSRLEKKITNLGKTVSAVWKKWSVRNRAVSEEMAAVAEQADAQRKAYETYMAKAAAVGLPEAYAELVRGGAIEISAVTDDGLAEQINEYQKWYDKALDCKDAVEDLKESLADLYSQAFDNVSAEFDRLLQEIEHKKSLLDEQISRTEEKGWLVSISYYKALAETEQANLKRLEEEKAALQSALQNAVANGAIEESSEEWYRMQGEINDVTLAIEEAKTAMISYGNSIREIEWKVFDLMQEKISRITSESDFLSELLSRDTLYDDDGRITDEGMSVMGLHGLNYNLYMEQSKKYAEEIAKLDEQLAKDPYNQELAARRQELLEQQQEMILAAEDEKQAIADMVKDGIELELSAMKKLIDTYTNALDAQKDLYDYQKKIAEQTEEIASLEKQITAYENDSSEEAKARLQKLKVSLEDARESLADAQYERYLSDQKQMLDELYNEYELALNSRLDEIDALMSEMIAEINRNAGVISATLSEKAEAVGITLSENMSGIWTAGAQNLCNVLILYGDRLNEGISSAATAVNNTLTAINTGIAEMIARLDRLADEAVSSLSGNQAADAGGSSGASSGGPSDSSSENPGGASSDSSSGAWGSWFIPKEDCYPKDKLHIETSVVDRLKYHNFDSSFSACLSYYSAMGGSGAYTGSAEQNAWMLAQMKAHGYKNGAYRLGRNELAWTQENGKPEAIIRPGDGAILTPLAKGDSVLNAEATETLFRFANRPADFIHSSIRTAMPVPVKTGSVSQTCRNSFEFSVNLPNVMNYSDFKYAMQHDRNFEKMVQAMTVGAASGGSALKKYRC